MTTIEWKAASKRPSDRSFAKATRARIADMDRIAGRLGRGKIDAATWADQFHAILVRGHSDAYTLGRQRAGDLTAQTEADERFGLDAADGQGEFLTGFLADLEGGRYHDAEGNFLEGPFMVRSRQYATRFRGTANEAFVDAGEDDDEYDWILGPTEHCADCVTLSGLNPYVRGAIISHPGDGQTDCKVNCHCRWVRRRDGLSGFARVNVFASPVVEDAPEAPPRDALSADLFGEPAAVEDAPDPRELARLTKRLFGRELSPQEIANVVAAPKGSKVNIDADDDTLRVSVVHDEMEIDMDRVFHRDRDGKGWVYHEFFRADQAPKGTGLRIFAKQVQEYARLGLDRIETDAAGGPNDKKWNGYYTWPRFGYNMALRPAMIARLAREGFDVVDLNGLFLYDEGAAWWKANGIGGHMEFDLAEGSRSMAILRAYMTKNRVRL